MRERAPSRLAFVDGLRGLAVVLMVVNHTARWWLPAESPAARFPIVYGSMLLPAALFLFLAGFCLPISHDRRRAAAGDPGGPRGLAAGRSPDGALSLLRQYGPRGVGLVAAGVLLNVLVFPDLAPWSGGVLQTIGLAVVLIAPLVPLLQARAGRAAALALAVTVYAAFWAAYPALAGWVDRHPEIGRVLFLDFPPWPWIAVALVGAVMGARWLEVRREGPAREGRYMRTVAIAGVVALVAHDLAGLLVPASARFGFARDFALNGRWTPRPATVLLIAGGVALLLAAAHGLMAGRGWRLPWLVALGRTALLLYFAHHLLALTLVGEWLGIRFASGPAYGAATAALSLALVALARARLALGRAPGRARGAAWWRFSPGAVEAPFDD